MKIIFLILAAIIVVGSVLPYARDILRGTTRPNVVTWLTWTILAAIILAAQLSAHEYIAAVYTGGALAEASLILLLGRRYGYAKYSRFDILCQAGAIAAIVLWQVSGSATIGVVGAVVIDLLGALPTIRHSWLKPHEETWSAYAIGVLAGGFAIAALSTYNWVSLTYAVYLVLDNGLIAAIIFLRQAQALKAPSS